MASYFGFSKVVAYASSKSAVLGITRGLAVERSQENILVNSVSPGWFPSEMSKQVMDREQKENILAECLYTVLAIQKSWLRWYFFMFPGCHLYNTTGF